MQNFMEIQDGHFQLCQKVADLAWNDSLNIQKNLSNKFIKGFFSGSKSTVG
jgi:hypothetical protein